MRNFEQFYLATAARVLRAVALVAESNEDARDCVQEAFVRAAARWPSLREESAEAWVRRVALNLALDSHRRRGVRQRLARRLAPRDVVDPPSDLVLDVVWAIRQLPRPQQEVVVLHHLLDMSVEDVSRDLERSQNTVKTQLVRGRARLAELLRVDVEVLAHE